MTHYSLLSLSSLRETLWKEGVIPTRWMLSYIKKDEALKILTKLEQLRNTPEYKGRTMGLPEKYLEELRQRQKEHLDKAKKAKLDRQSRFGVSKLTTEECLREIVRLTATLDFVERRSFDKTFTSAGGTTRGKVAIVFRDETGKEYLFTRSETAKLADLGVEVPREALGHGKPKPAGVKSLGDLFS